MKRFTLLFLMLFLWFNAQSQTEILKSHVIEDFNYLNDVLAAAHPANWSINLPKKNSDDILIHVENLQEKSIPISDYFPLLNSALNKFECIHTNIVNNPLEINSKNEANYFPYQLILFEGNLFLKSEKTTKYEEVIQINGVNAYDIIKWVLEYRGSDGRSDAFAKGIFKKYSSKLISQYFEYPNSYEIVTDKSSITKQAITTPNSTTPFEYQGPKVLSNKENHLTIENNVAYLKINSFSKSDKKFFKKAFSVINNYDDLIIDLRDNLGGNRNAGIYLTRNLIDTTFSYAILMPKLKTYKYLDGKGKFNFLLSKLKYNIGNALKGTRTPLGMEFRYTYSPLKKGYAGNIYVITNGLTASTSTMVTSWLQQHTSTTFVGTQAGGGYNGNNGGSFPTITLPNSKIQIRIAAYRLLLDSTSSMDTGIIPEYNPYETISDFNNSIDVDLPFTLDLIKNKGKR